MRITADDYHRLDDYHRALLADWVEEHTGKPVGDDRVTCVEVIAEGRIAVERWVWPVQRLGPGDELAMYAIEYPSHRPPPVWLAPGGLGTP